VSVWWVSDTWLEPTLYPPNHWTTDQWRPSRRIANIFFCCIIKSTAATVCEDFSGDVGWRRKMLWNWQHSGYSESLAYCATPDGAFDRDQLLMMSQSSVTLLSDWDKPYIECRRLTWPRHCGKGVQCAFSTRGTDIRWQLWQTCSWSQWDKQSLVTVSNSHSWLYVIAGLDPVLRWTRTGRQMGGKLTKGTYTTLCPKKRDPTVFCNLP